MSDKTILGRRTKSGNVDIQIHIGDAKRTDWVESILLLKETAQLLEMELAAFDAGAPPMTGLKRN